MKVQRIEEPTPNGGDYSEIHYFDDGNNPVDEADATKCVIRECRADGELISETWGAYN